jgi:uncharacterized protein (TIGR00369 family)
MLPEYGSYVNYFVGPHSDFDIDPRAYAFAPWQQPTRRERMPFQPQDPNFHERVRISFSRQRVMQTLGIEIMRLEPGDIELAMSHDPAYTQQHGFMHAGIVTTALDSACGYAAFSLMPAEAAVLTVEFKTNLLAPAKGERFLFRGRVVKPGRTLTVCEAQAVALAGNAEERLVATMTGTLMALFERQGIVQ